jgi:hypothetical protein
LSNGNSITLPHQEGDLKMSEVTKTETQEQFDLSVHADAVFGEHRGAGWG